jgi:hypothetical protein
MTFARRLRAYMIGLIIGTAMVIVIFNDRLSILTDWLPGNRVLVELSKSEMSYSPKSLCELKCLGLDSSQVNQTIQEGKVRFSLSETRADPRIYAIDQRIGDRLIRLHFALSEPKATLVHAEAPITVVDCGC